MIQFADLTPELQDLVRHNCLAAHAYSLARQRRWSLRRFLEFVAVQMAKQSMSTMEDYQRFALEGPPPNVIVMDEAGIKRLQLEYIGPRE